MNRAGSRGLLALGLALAVVAIAGATSSLVSLWWLRGETTTRSYAASAGVDIDAGCGSVTVRGADIDVTRVTAHVVWSFKKPTLRTSMDGDVRMITSACPAWSAGNGGSADLTVTVPESTNVTVRSAAEAVHVEGVSGVVEAQSSADDVEGTALTARRVSAHSSAGDVELSFDRAPDRVTASSAAGDVHIRLPDGPQAYRVNADSSAGSTDTDVRTDPTATRTIAASSSAGDVQVSYRD